MSTIEDAIVIAGCGIAGLDAALRLERALDREIVVVNNRSRTVFYPGLHRVLDDRSFDDVTIDLEATFEDRDIRLVEDTVTGLDPYTRTVQCESGDIGYRKLLIALGSTTAFHGVDPSAETVTLRFKEDVKRVKGRIADGAIDDAVVVGGGATGVEAAASLLAASRHGGGFSVTVVEADDRLLTQFSESMGETVERAFERKGIAVETGTIVTDVADDAVRTRAGEAFPTDMTIWAGGVAPPPIIETLPLPSTADGIPVDATLQVEGRPDIYAAGDIADYDGAVDRALFALREAKTVATNIARDLQGKERIDHTIGADPNLVYLGPRDALFEFKGMCWRGIGPALMRSWGVEKRYMFIRRHIL